MVFFFSLTLRRRSGLEGYRRVERGKAEKKMVEWELSAGSGGKVY